MSLTVVDNGSQQQGSTWNPEKTGEFLMGVYLGSQDVTTKKGPAVVYTVRDDQGQEHGIFGNYNTNKYFQPLAPGSYVIIVFKGKVKTKRDNDVNTYAFAFDQTRPTDEAITDFLSEAEADPEQMTKVVTGTTNPTTTTKNETDDIPF